VQIVVDWLDGNAFGCEALSAKCVNGFVGFGKLFGGECFPLLEIGWFLIGWIR